MNRICKSCNGMVVMHAMQYKNCTICDQEFLASNIPGEEICPDCEKENPQLCPMCGKKNED